MKPSSFIQKHSKYKERFDFILQGKYVYSAVYDGYGNYVGRACDVNKYIIYDKYSPVTLQKDMTWDEMRAVKFALNGFEQVYLNEIYEFIYTNIYNL